MSYYDEDFFYEPTEFEGQLEEFKQVLTESIRDDYKEKMAQLEKENAELRVIKNDFETIKQSYEDAKRELRFERSDMERSIRRERLTELMKDFEITLYHAELKFETGPKCDKCNERRAIEYITPLGKEC